MRKLEKIEKKCKSCNKSIFVLPSALKEGKGKYCSISCKAKKTIAGWNKGKPMTWVGGHKWSEESRRNLSMKQQGITNILEWKGFKKAENYLERRRFQHEMQKKVFKRDGWKCTLCDSKYNLQVDHIQSWAKFPNLRFDINNCRTLCSKCHYQITFGKPMPENIKTWGHNFMKGRELI